MLHTLNIRNIAIIDSAEVTFGEGLNIISGETGAGKSIVIEAISLLLGSRAKAELIRSGCDEAIIEGLFDVKQIRWFKERMERLGFSFNPDAPNELLIKRIIHSGGRHRIFVNGELCTLSTLQTLCEGLVDLCGQHEHQSLTKAPIQLELLDRFGEQEKASAEIVKLMGKRRELLEECAKITASEAEREKRVDFIKFQIEELRAAQLTPGEDQALQEEKQLLQSAEARVQVAEGARLILESEEDGTLNQLRAALNKMRTLEQMDERTRPQLEALERAVSEAEDVALELNRYLGSVDLNTERLVQIQDRLSMIADFRRKYGADIDEMLATLDQLESEYTLLTSSDAKLEELKGALATLDEELLKKGKKLSAARSTAADKLSGQVTGELKDLKMADALFEVEVVSRAKLEEWTHAGADQVQFVVQTNRGEPARALGRIASGGELSRIMLAIRRVISDRGGIGVYLFDEIDAGIGGQTAFQVGKKLKSVAKQNQVLCITHLPQVASFADQHLSVRKITKGKRTVTEVLALNSSERKEELARMLGGAELTKKSLENASELMQMASVT